ncbi:atg26 [Symbiodinium sp. CCMP2456]|nr:atg26 [Symbiodinium sp. CCMP2456]
MEAFESVWLPRILQMFSGPAALKALRSCRSLKRLWPRCLQAGEGFWILEQLETVTLEKLLERDADLCNCFLWARSDMKNHKISYTSFEGKVEIYTSMPAAESQKADSDEQESKPELIVRSFSESFAAMNGNESLELTRRRLAFPRTMSQKLPELFAGALKVVGEESPALMAMGLCGWEVSKTSEKSPTDSRWLHFCFHRPKPKIPLAIFHLSGEFSLPGGDGLGEVCLGYVSTDLDYVVCMREFSEYPTSRHLASKVCTQWEEGQGLLHTWGPQPGALSDEGTKIEEILQKITTPDGWDVERTSMYMDENRCIMGCPFLKAIYQDAKQLLESCKRDST